MIISLLLLPFKNQKHFRLAKYDRTIIFSVVLDKPSRSSLFVPSRINNSLEETSSFLGPLHWKDYLGRIYIYG